MHHFSTIIAQRTDFVWCWFLRGLGPDGVAIERLLHDIGLMDHSGWVPRPASTLTRSGAPVQVTFRAGIGPRLTIDLPGSAPKDRVARASDLLSDQDGQRPDPTLREMIATAQSAGPLSYGAYLDIPVAQDRRTLRLLAELPTQAPDLTGFLLPKAQDDLHQIGDRLGMHMLTYDGESGALGLQGRITHANWPDLLPLCQIAQVTPDSLAIALQGLARIPAGDTFPVAHLDFRLTAQPDGTAPELCLLLDAQDLLGDDMAIHARVMACGGQHLRFYQGLISQLDRAPQGKAHHGQIGLTARADQMPQLSVTLAAPWETGLSG